MFFLCCPEEKAESFLLLEAAYKGKATLNLHLLSVPLVIYLLYTKAKRFLKNFPEPIFRNDPCEQIKCECKESSLGSSVTLTSRDKVNEHK